MIVNNKINTGSPHNNPFSLYPIAYNRTYSLHIRSYTYAVNLDKNFITRIINKIKSNRNRKRCVGDENKQQQKEHKYSFIRFYRCLIITVWTWASQWLLDANKEKKKGEYFEFNIQFDIAFDDDISYDFTCDTTTHFNFSPVLNGCQINFNFPATKSRT